LLCCLPTAGRNAITFGVTPPSKDDDSYTDKVTFLSFFDAIEEKSKKWFKDPPLPFYSGKMM